jgi:hypothetical protein
MPGPMPSWLPATQPAWKDPATLRPDDPARPWWSVPPSGPWGQGRRRRLIECSPGPHR